MKYSDIIDLIDLKKGQEGGKYKSKKRVLKRDKHGRMSWGWGDYKYTEPKGKKKQSGTKAKTSGSSSRKKKPSGKTPSKKPTAVEAEEGKSSLDLVREAMAAAGMQEHVTRAKIKHEGQTLADVVEAAKEAEKKRQDEKADRDAKRQMKREEREKERAAKEAETGFADVGEKESEPGWDRMPESDTEVVEKPGESVNIVELTQQGLVRLVRKDEAGRDVAKWVTAEVAQWHRENKTETWEEPAAGEVDVRTAMGSGSEKLSDEAPEGAEEYLLAEEFDMGNLIEQEAFKVAENRPPNFLGMLPEPFNFKTSYNDKGFKIYIPQLREEDGSAAQLPTGEYDVKELTAAQLLLHTGFMENAPEGPLAHGFQKEFFYGLVGRSKRYEQLPEKMQSVYAPIARNLAAWWTNLRDDEREAFWGYFVDEDWQTTIGRVTDRRHEDGEYKTPKGMEKLTKRGFSLHEYQRKAVNFCLNHAPRAIWGMEMGLGKTLSAIGLYHSLREKGQANRMFITAPKSAHGSWEDHFTNFSDLGDDAEKRGRAKGRLRKGKAVILTGASKKQRLAAYEAWAKGETQAIVCTPQTLQKRWEDIPNHFKLAPDTPTGSEYRDPQTYEVVQTKRVETEGEKLSKKEQRKAMEAYPEGTKIRVTHRQQGVSDYFTRVEGGWARSVRIDQGQHEEDVSYAYDEILTHEQVQAMYEEDVLSYINIVQRAARNQQRAKGIRYPTLQVIPPDSDYAIIKGLMEKHGNDTLRIADEVHQFKDPNSAQGQGFVDAVCKPVGRVVGMSGTPKPNGAEDFFHIINAIAPGTLGDDVKEFGTNYCYTEGKGANAKILGFRPEKLGNMYRDSADMFFCRTTADPDVELNLPERKDLAPRIPMDDTQEKMAVALMDWMKVRNEIAKARAKAGGGGPEAEEAGVRAETLQLDLDKARSDDNKDHIDRTAARAAPVGGQDAMMRMIQLSVDPRLLDAQEGYARRFSDDAPGYMSPKMDNCTDTVMNHLSQNPDKGAVMFCEYNGGVKAAVEALVAKGLARDQIAVYTGATSDKKRRQAEKDLNDGTIKVIVGNTGALQTGANLQHRANFVVHLNTPWKPDALAQSIARVHRQGQTSNVVVYRPTGHPVEELVERTVSRKLMQSAQAMGRTMEADDAIAVSMRQPGKTGLSLDNIAETLGVDASDFMATDEKPKTLEEIEEKQRRIYEKEQEKARKRKAEADAAKKGESE